MAVTLVSCYFFPFLLFFLAQLALPKSVATFALGIAGVSLSTLILYFQLKNQQPIIIKQEAQVVPVSQEKVLLQKEEKVKISQLADSPILSFFKKALACKPACKMADSKAALKEATIKEQERLIQLMQEENRQKEKLLVELQKHVEMTQQLLSEKDEQLQSQEQELKNLKFEMYTLLRIDSYMGSKESSESNKLVSASF